jgi:TonB family protein
MGQMAARQSSSQSLVFVLPLTGTKGKTEPVTGPLALSLLLHLALLLIFAFMSFKTGERPLSSAVQVSLITLPPAPPTPKSAVQKSQPPVAQTPPKPVTQPQSKPEPRPAPTLPPPPPAIQKAPAPIQKAPTPVAAAPKMPATQPVPPQPKFEPITPPPAPPVSGPKRGAENPFRGALKDFDLPRQVPKFGELSPDRPVVPAPQPIPDARPQRVPDRTRTDVTSLLSKLKVPETRELPAVPPPTVENRPQPRERQTSLSEEFQQELERELKRAKEQPMPKPQENPAFSTATVKTVDTRPREIVKHEESESKPVPPAVTAKLASTRPDMTINVPGAGPGSNAYLARVQQLISQHWTAPQVEMTGKSLTVVIRFRLNRTGAVSGVMVEQSSGSEYYDLAGKRAVLNADPLPPFPKDLAGPYFDAHFSFVVGDSTG